MRISDWSSDVCSSDLPLRRSSPEPNLSSQSPRPKKRSARPRIVATLKTQTLDISARLSRQEVAHPVTCARRLLNISCLAKSHVEIAGQTGLAARRVADGRRQHPPAIGRPSCGERACHHVSIRGGAASCTNKTQYVTRGE